jgi:uncharacterized ferritin-like protein (DUF455 family)
MPKQYYADWIGVAAEEAYHFQILRQRLLSLGHDYGDFPAHAGLWEMAAKTSLTMLLARMALVPRLLEARGLDATPPIQRKLEPKRRPRKRSLFSTSFCAMKSAMSASATLVPPAMRSAEPGARKHLPSAVE